MKNNQGSVKITKAQKAQVIKDSAQAAAQAPAKNSKLKALGGVALDVVKAVAPEVAGMVPVVGPVLKTVLSTMNDDEWFAEYASAGATFNELLGDINLDKSTESYRHITGCIVTIESDVLADKATATITWRSMLLPTILAYVRKRTDNVLVATETDYWTAFLTASRLYALYYTLKKYVDLVSDIPLNIPNLTETIPMITPINYSQLHGIVTSLESYLDTTIRLPYAWVSYLRWRFGTMFLSENTGKPGLIAYDFPFSVYGPNCVFSSALTPAAVSGIIDTFKNTLSGVSRATADLRLAYEDHEVKYTVEDRHYDEKEFNLRCNLNSDEAPIISGTDPFGTILYMDSRLDAHAAIQAVTLSTGSSDNWAPFKVRGMWAAWYTPADYLVPFTNVSGTAAGPFTVNQGWSVCYISYRLDHTYNIYVDNGQGGYEAKVDARIGYNGVHTVEVSPTIPEDAARLAYTNILVPALILDTLQIHGQDWLNFVITTSGMSGAHTVQLRGKPLSYDTALISPTQISAIHRIALRNLTRGEYKRKTQPSQKDEVKEAVAEVVNETSDLMLNKI